MAVDRDPARRTRQGKRGGELRCTAKGENALTRRGQGSSPTRGAQPVPNRIERRARLQRGLEGAGRRTQDRQRIHTQDREVAGLDGWEGGVHNAGSRTKLIDVRAQSRFEGGCPAETCERLIEVLDGDEASRHSGRIGPFHQLGDRWQCTARVARQPPQPAGKRVSGCDGVVEHRHDA